MRSSGSLNDSEWDEAKKAREQHARDSEYDSHRRALYYLLNGDFDIRTTTGQLYGEGGPVNISLLDFANFACRVVDSHTVPSELVTFDQLDDDRRIQFDFSTPLVRISASDSETSLEVARAEAIGGLKQFLMSLAQTIDQREPGLFDWRSLDPLVGYRDGRRTVP